MSSRQEFIGVRILEAVDAYGKDVHRYSIILTDTEIIRCRDCNRSDEVVCDGGKCGEEPDGFCAWAVRRDVR